MQLIEPYEKELTGNWLVEDGQVRADPTCERVQWLAQNVLVKIADSKEGGGWETLYQDPADSRLWERTYPQSEMHGGGPPQLKLLTEEEAAKKYDGFPKSLKTPRF